MIDTCTYCEIITTRNRVNICHHTIVLKTLFLQWEFWSATFLAAFIYAMLEVCTFDPLRSRLPPCMPHLWPPPICSLYLWLRFCFCPKISHRSETVQYFSSSDLVFIARHPQDLSTLPQMTRFHSFLWLNRILCLICNILCFNKIMNSCMLYTLVTVFPLIYFLTIIGYF